MENGKCFVCFIFLKVKICVIVAILFLTFYFQFSVFRYLTYATNQKKFRL
jgi:hypothetical protein